VPQAIWDAVVRQCGAIKVARMEELIDTLKALLYLSPVRGDRVAIMAGGSGGQTVAIADVFAEAGLRVPQLTQESYDELASFFILVGASCRNPIDTGRTNRPEMRRILEILERDANTDNLMLLTSIRTRTPEEIETDIDFMANIRERTTKPVMTIVSFSTPNEMEEARNTTQKFQERGIPAFPSMERGALALRNTLDYYSLKSSIDT